MNNCSIQEKVIVLIEKTIQEYESIQDSAVKAKLESKLYAYMVERSTN